jgi:hypothetical protein
MKSEEIAFWVLPYEWRNVAEPERIRRCAIKSAAILLAQADVGKPAFDSGAAVKQHLPKQNGQSWS